MSTTAIYDAFCVAAEAFAAARDLSISMPGVGFTAPAEGLWLEFSWFPGQTQNYARDDDAPALLQGFAQLSVCGRPGAGAMPLMAVADAAIVAFAKGTTVGAARIYRKPYQGPPIPDPERLMVPVTIWWRGFDR